VDAIVSDTALGYELEQRGQARLMMPSSAYAPDFLTNVMFAAQPFATAKGDVLTRFLAAWFDAARWMPGHKKEVVESARRVTGLSQAVTERQFDESVGMFSRDGHITLQQLQIVERAVLEAGLVDSKPDLAPFYTDQFLPK
jgi:ABC-type nitrate/sulfonate/bicarbonate transport system substrate-binding protein